MPDNDAFVHDFLLPDSNTRRSHVGDACQWSPPVPEGEVLPEVAGMIEAHRATIHAPGARPRGRFGLDEDGKPIETSYLGVGVDPETGALIPLDNDGNARVAKSKGKTEPKPKPQADKPQADPKPEQRPAPAAAAKA